jgi:ring-1,2-phenylacetyl-CoA epoxidase subunit PaaE
MTPHFNRLTVKDIRRETPDAVSVTFDVPPDLAAAYRFDQGQYVTLRTMLGGEERRRSYSICSGLDDGEIRIGVKKVPGGQVSTFVNEALRVGDVLDVMTPMGRFTTPLVPSEPRVHLAVACGSGITPVLSIVKTVLAREPESRVVLVYGNRTADDIMFRTTIDDLKDSYVDRLSVFHVLSRQGGDVPLLSGRIDRDKLARIVTRTMAGGHVDHAFLCGPFGMIEEARAALEGLGVPHARIHVELFSTDGARPIEVPRPSTTLAPGVASAEVIFAGRRQTIAVTPSESIVDAARRQGVEVPFSCKGGMCCTCRAKIVEGEVRMDVNYSLEPWETTAGFVLTCQSHPVTSKVVVDYDAL